jgi:hypothetical protein
LLCLPHNPLLLLTNPWSLKKTKIKRCRTQTIPPVPQHPTALFCLMCHLASPSRLWPLYLPCLISDTSHLPLHLRTLPPHDTTASHPPPLPPSRLTFTHNKHRLSSYQPQVNTNLLPSHSPVPHCGHRTHPCTPDHLSWAKMRESVNVEKRTWIAKPWLPF